MSSVYTRTNTAEGLLQVVALSCLQSWCFLVSLEASLGDTRTLMPSSLPSSKLWLQLHCNKGNSISRSGTTPAHSTFQSHLGVPGPMDNHRVPWLGCGSLARPHVQHLQPRWQHCEVVIKRLCLCRLQLPAWQHQSHSSCTCQQQLPFASNCGAAFAFIDQC
jgi:hypothetical protein